MLFPYQPLAKTLIVLSVSSVCRDRSDGVLDEDRMQTAGQCREDLMSDDTMVLYVKTRSLVNSSILSRSVYTRATSQQIQLPLCLDIAVGRPESRF